MNRLPVVVSLLLLASCGGWLARNALLVPDWEPTGAPARKAAATPRPPCEVSSPSRRAFSGSVPDPARRERSTP
jgi:hypothetical protein